MCVAPAAGPAEGSVPAPFVYQGEVIHDRGEMLSLTDMWKASGSPSGRAPPDWLVLPGTADFVNCVEASHNAGKSGIIAKKVGKSGGTWAHWQVAMAYAKYLSPAFHVWCNKVVRERMTRQPVPFVDHGKIGRQVAAIIDDKIELALRRIPVLIDRAVEERIAADPRRAVLDFASVLDLLNEFGAVSKGRNGLNRRVGHGLREAAHTNRLKDGTPAPVSLRRCPHSGKWLFPRDLSTAYMAKEGRALIQEHNDRVMGQGVIKFPDRRKDAGHKQTPSLTASLTSG